MFYESVKAAYLAGKVRVGLPTLGRGDRIYVEASGLVGLKAAFLSNTERRLLADLSKSDAEAMTRVCVACKAPLEPSLKAVLQGEHHCDCGAVYKVISATSDVSQLRGLEVSPEIILGNCNVKIFKPSTDRPGE